MAGCGGDGGDGHPSSSSLSPSASMVVPPSRGRHPLHPQDPAASVVSLGQIQCRRLLAADPTTT
uniref:Uncharacterized protein n=1 Tax=Oryza meridionalis TaxID=40149 RepID=A0A0E0E3H5_9ORYZ